MLTFGSLFAGIGGFDLGLERAGMKCSWQVEIDPFCNKVLEKHWPSIERFSDVREVGRHNLSAVDLICGGVPCQPASQAGKRRGERDDRWLWPETFRIVEELHPTWCLFENVTGLLTLEQGVVFDNLLTTLGSKGYDVQAFIIPAYAIGARHRRNRVWIVANANSIGQQSSSRRRVIPNENWNSPSEIWKCKQQQGAIDTSVVAYAESVNGEWTIRNRDRAGQPKVPTRNGSGDVSHSDIQGLEGRDIDRQCANELTAWQSGKPISDYWLIEPNVGRVANGVPNRVDRLRALGNAVVPQIVEVLGRAIIEADNILNKCEDVKFGT